MNELIEDCKNLCRKSETISIFDVMNYSRKAIQDIYYDTSSDLWGDCYEVDYPYMFDYMIDSYVKTMNECRNIIANRKEVKE